MKVRADEHVSPEIVRAVREMALSPEWELTQVIDIGDRSSEDEHWITKFAKEGGHAILSGDRDFLNRPNLILAVNRTGLRVIHMPAKWSNAGCALQAAHILLWWRRIETKISSMSGRECYRPPWNISEEGDLNRIGVDYQNAEKWQKRQAKRSAKAVANEQKAEAQR